MCADRNHDTSASPVHSRPTTAANRLSSSSSLVPEQDESTGAQLELKEIKSHHDNDPELGWDLELKQTGSSRKSVVIESNYEIPITDMSKGIIGWDGKDDPENPRNWPQKKKMSVLALISGISFISPLASSMFAPGISIMNKDFGNTSVELSSFVISVFILGWAVGPLVLSPLSEIYGRRRVIDAANIIFVVWQLGCALAPNIEALIIFRFLAGVGGSGCLTIGGGVISDLFAPEVRGAASALFSVGPLFGPVIGPIAGGFLAQRVGWRWVFWVLLISGGAISSFIIVVNKETNPHVLISRKVQRLKAETGNQDLISWYEKGVPARTPAMILGRALTRPMKLLFTSPITAVMCTYMSTIYGILYLLFTSLPLVFAQQYAWEPEITGLSYLGIGIGFFAGAAIMGKTSDGIVIRLSARNGGVAEPEMRLPLSAGFGTLIPISLLWYGWSAEKNVHWIVPIIGMVPMGIGLMGVFVPVQTFLIDAFPEHAASAIAALTATRSLLGAALPLAGGPMYAKLGLGWGNTLLGFLSLALVPPVWLIYKHGKTIRMNHPVNLD